MSGCMEAAELEATRTRERESAVDAATSLLRLLETAAVDEERLSPLRASLSSIAGRDALHTVRDRRGRTVLHVAAECGALGVVTNLLTWNADVGVVDKSGETALHAAARAGHSAILEALLASHSGHAMLDKQSRGKGDTALILAACHAHPECRALLEAAGADPTLTTRNGWDAERWAQSTFAAHSAKKRAARDSSE